MVSGPQIGIFVCGLFLPWINERVSAQIHFSKSRKFTIGIALCICYYHIAALRQYFFQEIAHEN